MSWLLRALHYRRSSNEGLQKELCMRFNVCRTK